MADLSAVARILSVGGEGGIRTHEPLRATRFPIVPLQPLRHLSKINCHSRGDV